MKALLGLILVFAAGFAVAQQAVITFYGESEPVSRLNSPYDENFLSLAPGGKTMILTRRNHPANVGDRHNPGDLWISKYDSAWSIPRSSTNQDPLRLVAPLGFVNGEELFLYNTTYFDKGVFRGSIWVAEVKGEQLQDPRKLEIANFQNFSEHQSGSISADGKTIVFSMEGNFTYGVEDLYVSHLQGDGTWSSPKNLGYRLNTAFQEYTPFLAADKETLVFATNGRTDGLGSFDLYITTRIDNTWQNWTEPLNLGPEVNSKGAETSFLFEPGGKFAYFVSTTDSDGYGDVRRIRIQSEIEASIGPDTVSFTIREAESPDAKVFQLVDEAGDMHIDGRILLIGDTINLEIESGGTVHLPAYPDLTVETRSSGYLNHMVQLTSAQLVEQDTFYISVDALSVGNTINLEHVLFHQGTANFIEGSEKELDRVVEMLEENPRVKILLKGHTDNVGDPRLNLELSRERVKVVQEYLLASGIDRDRISGKGYGGNDPIAPNDTEANRKLNRRVEFTIVEN